MAVKEGMLAGLGGDVKGKFCLCGGYCVDMIGLVFN